MSMALFCLALWSAAGSGAQAPPMLSGRVVDARTLTPLPGVPVLLEEAGRTALTDSEGRFVFRDVAPGRHSLSVSWVGYILVRRTVALPAADELTIPLSEGTGAYTENVTVRGNPLARRDEGGPSSQTLGSADVQNLRGVLADDPLRAVHALPSVAADDDFQSEFSVRGSDFRHIGISLDGVSTPLLIHTVRGVRTTGSVGAINSDILDTVTLSAGAYPQVFGNHTGADLQFITREGSRDRTELRAAVSGTSASFVFDGPIGAGKRGSWLVSGRQSYLDLIAKQLFPKMDFSFGFRDAHAKAVYDVSSRHQLEASVVAGRARLDDRPVTTGLNSIFEAENEVLIGSLALRSTFRRSWIVTQRASTVVGLFHGDNRDGVELSRESQRDVTYRVTASFAPSAVSRLQASSYVQHKADAGNGSIYDSRRRTYTRWFEFAAAASSAGGHIQYIWRPRESWSVKPGARLDRWGLVGRTSASPWLQVDRTLTATTALRMGAGLYQQAPDIEQTFGPGGRTGLRPERAWHVDVGLEDRRPNGVGWQVTLYDREERDALWRLDAEPRLVNGRVWVPPAESGAGFYDNALRGHSRGVELLVQRRAATGLTGWAAYSLGVTRYRNLRTGEVFWGDYDQRHTLNMYGQYRLSERASLTAKFRLGSNFPIAGYVAARDGVYVATDRRNEARLPTYSRLDLRANRTVKMHRSRLTLFVEVLNVLNHANLRQSVGSFNTTTGLVSGLTTELLPILPSAGILVEF